MLGEKSLVDKRVRTDLSEVSVTENQLKVIKDKYLKDDKTVSQWLSRIARNIALGDFFYEDSISEEEIFDGVNYKKIVSEVDGKPVYLLHDRISDYGQRKKNFSMMMNNLYGLTDKSKKVKQLLQATEDKFYRMLANWEFLPGSPTLMNAGRELQQLSSCYVLPVGDSLEDIYGSLMNMAIIHKSGGGTGFDFSSLRPSNDFVMSTKGVSSGPISFMSLFDKSTDVVKQGGTRRGANMGTLRYDHPNVLDFIECKKVDGQIENFNISVTVDKRFMDAVANGSDYDLINPRTREVTGRLNAREVFDKMIDNAWETGDPGIIFIDRMNNPSANPTPHVGTIVTTNPCGEQPLLPYDSCNLGSINLAKFVKRDSNDFDYMRLKECVWNAVHFLDNVVTVNNFPLPQIEYISKTNRRIGLGIMGWAESLILMNLAYDSDEAMGKAEEVMKFINDEALAASEALGEKRGAFFNWKNSVFDEEGPNFKGLSSKPRNCARTTIAPTGTIAIAAGLQGAGIEPFFAIGYVRYNAAGIDALKKGEKPKESDTFFEINPLFRRIAKGYNYFGLKEDELWNRINENHKSVKGIYEIPENVQRLFPTSHDITPEWHIKLQAAFQKYTDNAVSKTINLRKEATKDDVKNAYLLAYKLECKGITIYRDGSKKLQILNIDEKKKSRKASNGHEMSDYYKVLTGQGALHIHINYDESGPTRLFANITPTGTEISGLATSLGILSSKYFELGGDPVDLLRHLNSVKGDKPFGFGPNRIDSIPHAISKALREHLIKTGKLKPINGQTTIESSLVTLEAEEGVHVRKDNLYCSVCFSPNVELIAGCSEPTCFDCGNSKCS